MKYINIIKKINIIIILIFAISIVFSNYSQATVGDVFSGAKNFLSARRFNINSYR